MIDGILPASVAAVEAFDDPVDARLFPAEQELIRGAVDKRRREFTTVRHCARLALAELGLPAVPILPGAKREPRWPGGVVGSMTHCDGYRAAALARDGDLAAIGIDAEPHKPLREGVLAVIARPEEIPRLARLGAQSPDVHWDRLTFSAKESVYKAWFPLARRWLGFKDASIVFDPVAFAFTARLHQTGPMVGGRALTRLAGRWVVRDGLIVTSVTLPTGSAVPFA